MLLFEFFCGCRGFCHRTESNLLLFSYTLLNQDRITTGLKWVLLKRFLTSSLRGQFGIKEGTSTCADYIKLRLMLHCKTIYICKSRERLAHITNFQLRWNEIIFRCSYFEFCLNKVILYIQHTIYFFPHEKN